jgi:tRNA dimethylallyltransferase
MDKRIIAVVVGPTCSGKSDLGLALAGAFDGEIVNLDSIQVYRGLYVATAKTPLAERRGVPHHLIDIVEPTENYTAGRYAADAAACIAEIEARGRMAILVGGTGLYLNALRGRLFADDVRTDVTLRARLKALAARRGADRLHRLLRRVDPASAARLHPNDWSRVSRALEAYFQTGVRLSERRKNLPPPPEIAARMRIIALSPPRDILYEKINRRVDVMERNGLLEEIRGLLAAGVPLDAKAFEAHGYKRVVEFLRGERTYESAIEQMKTDTRHYAKRQLSWWRGEPETTWVDGFGGDPDVQRRVIELLRSVN